jgi:archaellum component FlaC
MNENQKSLQDIINDLNEVKSQIYWEANAIKSTLLAFNETLTDISNQLLDLADADINQRNQDNMR